MVKEALVEVGSDSVDKVVAEILRAGIIVSRENGSIRLLDNNDSPEFDELIKKYDGKIILYEPRKNGEYKGPFHNFFKT
ncbi:hypothetical protein KY339_05355 [Candidatus Woesearchaeota archaeon]|nr:hypothetical protein [Candidatus Woesearchaeota archaeon]